MWVLRMCSNLGIYVVYVSRCSMSFRGGGGGGGWLSTSPVGPGSITAPSATVGLLTHRSPCCPALQAARRPVGSPWILWRCDSSGDWLIFSRFLSIHIGSWLSADGNISPQLQLECLILGTVKRIFFQSLECFYLMTWGCTMHCRGPVSKLSGLLVCSTNVAMIC